MEILVTREIPDNEIFSRRSHKWDVETYALDEDLPWNDIEEASLESALNAIIQKIEDFFAVTIERSD